MSNETSVNRKTAAVYVDYQCDAAVPSSVTARDIFVSKGAWRVVSATATYATASTSGKLAIRKITDASAPGAAASATVIEELAAVINLDATINVPNNGTLTATDGARNLKPGDRLALNFSGTTTNLAGCLIQIELQPVTKYVD
jgi:3D (Asp-Asp-Asp) domain-containing protein